VRLGRGTEHGLKLILARAAAGDAIWFKATIDRIADILARHGDDDPVDVRRSKAIGILAQPAEALRLLCEHQDDDWDGSPEPDDLAGEPTQEDIDRDQAASGDDTAAAAAEADHSADTKLGEVQQPTSNPASSEAAVHRSLQITPAPFNPDKARPRAIVYVHLSEEALTAGSGVARVEEVGPVLLGRLHMLLGDHCTISLKPVIDLPPPAMSRSTATRSPPVCANTFCCVTRLMYFPTPTR
jgi:hypothetical protein